MARILSTICRKVRLGSSKSLMSISMLAVVEAGKQQKKLPRSFSTRAYQRAATTNAHITYNTLKNLVRRAIAGDISLLLRDFSINIERLNV